MFNQELRTSMKRLSPWAFPTLLQSVLHMPRKSIAIARINLMLVCFCRFEIPKCPNVQWSATWMNDNWIQSNQNEDTHAGKPWGRWRGDVAAWRKSFFYRLSDVSIFLVTMHKLYAPSHDTCSKYAKFELRWNGQICDDRAQFMAVYYAERHAQYINHSFAWQWNMDRECQHRHPLSLPHKVSIVDSKFVRWWCVGRKFLSCRVFYRSHEPMTSSSIVNRTVAQRIMLAASKRLRKFVVAGH